MPLVQILTVRQALEIQERHLDLLCPKSGKYRYADDVRRTIIEATNIEGLDLDEPMSGDVVRRAVPAGDQITDVIFKWQLDSYTHEVSEADFEWAFGSVSPLRNHYDRRFLCGEELIADNAEIYYYAHYYTESVDGETKFFTEPMTVEEYDRRFGKF